MEIFLIIWDADIFGKTNTNAYPPIAFEKVVMSTAVPLVKFLPTPLLDGEFLDVTQPWRNCNIFLKQNGEQFGEQHAAYDGPMSLKKGFDPEIGGKQSK